jgi:hypothetical protein
LLLLGCCAAPGLRLGCLGLPQQPVDPVRCRSRPLLLPQLDPLVRLALLTPQPFGSISAFLEQRARTLGLAHRLDLPALALEQLQLVDQRKAGRHRARHRDHRHHLVDSFDNLGLARVHRVVRVSASSYARPFTSARSIAPLLFDGCVESLCPAPLPSRPSAAAQNSSET